MSDGTEISGLEIAFKILDPRLKKEAAQPAYSTQGAAAMDLRACINERIVLRAGEVATVSAGFALHIKDTRYAGIILPRSGLGARDGLVIANTIGLMDSDYQGPYMMALWNRHSRIGNSIVIEPMQRVAQLVFVPVVRAFFKEVDEFDSSERGAGGFGSTGKL